MIVLSAIGYPLFVVAALNSCFAGLLLAQRQSKDPIRLPAAALAAINAMFCLVVAVAYVRASLGLSYDFFYRAAWVGWFTFAPFFEITYLLRGDAQRARRARNGLYFFGSVVLLLCFATDWIEVGAESLVPFVDRRGPLEQPLRVLAGIMVTYALYTMVRAMQSSTGRRRQQIAYLLLGMGFYGVAGLLIAFVVQVIDSLHFDPTLLGYFSLGWIALTAYSIIRHRLFDIRSLLARMASAALATLLLVCCVAALHWALAPVVGDTTAAFVASLSAGAVFFMTPLLGWIRRFVEHFLPNRSQSSRRVIDASNQTWAALATVKEVVTHLIDVTLQATGVVNAAVLVEEEDALRLKHAYGLPDDEYIELSSDGAIARWMRERSQIFVRDEQEHTLSREHLAQLDAELRIVEGEVVVPFRFQDSLRGVLVLGRKRDRNAFFQSDIDALSSLTASAAIALANAQLLEELQRAVRTRDDFLSIAGHELRTPLTALQINVQSLWKSTDVSERVRERLGATQRQVARLERLTNDLLDVSRITAHHLNLEREPFDLACVAREVVTRFADELERSGSILDLDADDPVFGSWDKVRIEQVLSNLLSNAIKYGTGAPVALLVEMKGESARIVVRDEGIGIETKDQDRIFGRFERAVSSNHFGGFGLGLWITKQVIDAHGGTIDVRSELGEGSTFQVLLPLS